MRKTLPALCLTLFLLLCLLPASAFAASEEAPSAPVIVAEGEVFYAYEGMTVYNNGGTVYNTLATVYNNGGVVYNNGGAVYNNGGVIYANSGVVYNNDGTVYNNEAEIYSLQDAGGASRVFGYYELRLAGYYEPYVVLDGVTTEPGSEKMIISEDSRCRISPYPGFQIVDAQTDAGVLSRDETDGSVTLSAVDADTTLTLIIRPDPPAFRPESGVYTEGQTVEISAPAGCEIHYSTDGSEPDRWDGYFYDGPFTVDDSCTIRAIASVGDLEPSESAALTLSFLQIVVPEFADGTEGYAQPAPQPVRVENRGASPVEIVSVSLDGADAAAFRLSYTGGRTVPGGKTNDSTWSVQPIAGLSAGVYEVSLVFAFRDGKTLSLPLRFTVLA